MYDHKWAGFTGLISNPVNPVRRLTFLFVITCKNS